MLTRVRIDAEGTSPNDVCFQLDVAFQLLNMNSVGSNWTFTGQGFSVPPSTGPVVVPRDTELVEEVYEMAPRTDGAIHWKGRRTVAFYATAEEEQAVPPVPAFQATLRQDPPA